VATAGDYVDEPYVFIRWDVFSEWKAFAKERQPGVGDAEIRLGRGGDDVGARLSER
jgi:hypothetical protein